MAEAKGSKKEERRRIMASESFHRKGFKEVRSKVEENMKQEYQSELVKDLKSSNYVMERDGVRVHLAKVGFTITVTLKLVLLGAEPNRTKPLDAATVTVCWVRASL